MGVNATVGPDEVDDCVVEPDGLAVMVVETVVETVEV